MRIGVAADHGGLELKVQLTAALKAAGYEVADFGAYELVTGDDYPDFVALLASTGPRWKIIWARGQAEQRSLPDWVRSRAIKRLLRHS
jgi:hypothetical protein